MQVMYRLGWNAAFLVFRHNDIDRTHYHVVSSESVPSLAARSTLLRKSETHGLHRKIGPEFGFTVRTGRQKAVNKYPGDRPINRFVPGEAVYRRRASTPTRSNTVIAISATSLPCWKRRACAPPSAGHRMRKSPTGLDAAGNRDFSVSEAMARRIWYKLRRDEVLPQPQGLFVPGI